MGHLSERLKAGASSVGSPMTVKLAPYVITRSTLADLESVVKGCFTYTVNSAMDSVKIENLC